jgi:hypothetical protein
LIGRHKSRIRQAATIHPADTLAPRLDKSHKPFQPARPSPFGQRRVIGLYHRPFGQRSVIGLYPPATSVISTIERPRDLTTNVLITVDVAFEGERD